MKIFSAFSVMALALFYLSSCQKEINFDDGNGNNFNSSCNGNKMQLKKWASLFNPDEYIEAEWNADGTIKMVKMNVPFSEYRNATYLYDNNRISEAVLRNNSLNDIFDTVVFHYDANGKVDSAYLRNSTFFNIALAWENGRLKKYTRYDGTDMMLYWDVETDAKGNIVKAVEWWGNGSGGFNKESTYMYPRDDRKNPFDAIYPYLLHLDDAYPVFRYWGPNNYTDQVYEDHTGSGIIVTTGHKYKYNENCYPSTSQMTFQGTVLFPDDDYQFTYY